MATKGVRFRYFSFFLFLSFQTPVHPAGGIATSCGTCLCKKRQRLRSAGDPVPWDPAQLALSSPALFHGFSGEVSPTVLGPRVVLPCVPFPPASFAVCRPVWGLLSGLYPFSRTTSRYRGLVRTVPIDPGSGVASLERGRRAGGEEALRTEGGALRAVCP